MRKLLPVIFLVIIAILVSCPFVKGQTATNWIMCNADFTNVAFSRSMMHLIYNHEYSAYDIDYSFTVFSNKGLNPLLFYLVREKEGMPRDYYALGCGIHLKRPGYQLFEQQVHACANTLRYWFDHAKDYNFRVWVIEAQRNVAMYNRATFSLYKYTPHYKIFLQKTKQYHGNWTVRWMWEKIKRNADNYVSASCLDPPEYYNEE